MSSLISSSNEERKLEVLRFSDEALCSLNQKVDDHISSHNDLVSRFNEYEKYEKKYRDDRNKQLELVIEATHSNTTAVSDLAVQVSKLSCDTRDIVELHKDFRGFARVASKIQAGAIWLMKWGAIGTSVAFALQWIVGRLK